MRASPCIVTFMLAKLELTDGFEACGAPPRRHFRLEGLVTRPAPGITRNVRASYEFQTRVPTRRREYPRIASKFQREHQHVVFVRGK